MKKKFFRCAAVPLLLSVFSGILCLIAAGGCARDLIVSEVLQIPENATIYTAYNIFYTNPEKVSSMNLLNGSMIPFGTEVQILSATEKEIKFKTVSDGREFTIQYEQKYRLLSPEQYLKATFTTKNADELSAGIRPVVYEKIRRGVVEKGMSKREAKLAYGPPCAFRTPNEDLTTWVFWTEVLVGKRLIFEGDLLTDILIL